MFPAPVLRPRGSLPSSFFKRLWSRLIRSSASMAWRSCNRYASTLDHESAKLITGGQVIEREVASLNASCGSAASRGRPASRHCRVASTRTSASAASRPRTIVRKPAHWCAVPRRERLRGEYALSGAFHALRADARRAGRRQQGRSYPARSPFGRDRFAIASAWSARLASVSAGSRARDAVARQLRDCGRD